MGIGFGFREIDLNVVLGLPLKVTLGTDTVSMDRLSNRYCEGWKLERLL